MGRAREAFLWKIRFPMEIHCLKTDFYDLPALFLSSVSYEEFFDFLLTSLPRNLQGSPAV